MTTRSLLIYLPGYPLGIEPLRPRHALASIAGVLLEGGHTTTIWDYGTLETVDAVYPHGVSSQAAYVINRIGPGANAHPAQAIANFWQLRACDKAYRAARDNLCRQVAREIEAAGELDFVVFELNDPDDLDTAATVMRHVRTVNGTLPFGAAGPLAGQFPQAVGRRCPDLDAVFIGDPEVSLAQWADRGARRDVLTTLPNIAYRRGTTWTRTEASAQVDLLSLAEPAFEPDIYPALENRTKLNLFTIEDSRGCPCRCNGCPSASENWHRLRLKPAQRVRDEIIRLGSLYGARVFHLQGRGAPASHALAVAREIRRAQLDIQYSRTAHVAYANRAAFGAIYQSGCRVLGFQADTGSQRLLDDFYGRGILVSQMERVLRDAHREQLDTVAHPTSPAPDEDYHTEAETLRFLTRAQPLGAPIHMLHTSEQSGWADHPRPFRTTACPPSRLIPGTATFPLPAEWWRLPARAIGPLSPSQALNKMAILRNTMEELGISTILDEKMVLFGHVTGELNGINEVAVNVAQEFARGEIESLAERVGGFNQAACVPLAASRFSPFAQLPTAVGD